jgi:hypothetical protein
METTYDNSILCSFKNTCLTVSMINVLSNFKYRQDMVCTRLKSYTALGGKGSLFEGLQWYEKMAV